MLCDPIMVTASVPANTRPITEKVFVGDQGLTHLGQSVRKKAWKVSQSFVRDRAGLAGLESPARLY